MPENKNFSFASMLFLYITCPRCGHRNRPAANVQLAILAIRNQLIPCKGKIGGRPCNAQLRLDTSNFPTVILNRAYSVLGIAAPKGTPCSAPKHSPAPIKTQDYRSTTTFIADDHGTVWLRWTKDATAVLLEKKANDEKLTDDKQKALSVEEAKRTCTGASLVGKADLEQAGAKIKEGPDALARALSNLTNILQKPQPLALSVDPYSSDQSFTKAQLELGKLLKELRAHLMEQAIASL